MLEDTIVACPKCHNELHVKVLNSGKRYVYVVVDDCPNCKTRSGSIERSLNSIGRKVSVKTEKSYIMTDPRG